ncbi:prealbumin-like fold domain-containing protein [Mumia sp. DW29H23]|uniref:prealbumin-like fold domain-containing protein n=1 Tax=Mumia sp. DW29H23 TaxID=3421241 RepID=UPI003D69F1A8
MRRGSRPGPARWLALAAAVLLAAVPAAVGAPAQAQVPGTLSLFKRIENLDTGASEGRRQLWEMHAVHNATGEEFSGDGLNGFQSRTVPDGDYTISESGGVDGYRFQDWECSDGFTSTDPTPTITVPPGGNVTCTVDNEAIQSHITLVKVVEGGSASPSDFQLTAQGPNNITGPGNSAAVTNQPARIGTYTLSESGPTGYTAGAWTCEAAAADGTVADLPVTNGQITVELDQNITCTITNSANLPHLTLVKEVVNTGGGTAAPGDWTLTASGPGQVLSGTSGSSDVSNVSVEEGTYDLSESEGPAGYDASDWVCLNRGEPVAAPGGSVTVDEDDDITCTVTNTWTGGVLTLLKSVEGGSAPPSSWTLSATGDDATLSGSSGVSGGLPAGAYDLAEDDGPSGYDLSGWACTPADALTGTTVTIAAGSAVTCTATNTWVPPHLTLRKVVVGGPDAATDWTLTADGPDGFTMSGATGSNDVSSVTVPVGTFTLSESGPDEDLYDASAWSCTVDGEPATVTDDQIAIEPEQDVVCTITNTWAGSYLTLAKSLDNGDGGAAAATDWTLAADGSTSFSGATGSPEVTRVPVAPGTYALSESDGPAGYTSDGWTCTGGTLTGDAVTLAADDDVTCTVANGWVGGFLTLIKVVDPETASPGEWTLTATGGASTDGTTLSGPSGSASVTRVPVPPGGYALAESGGPDGFALVGWECEGGVVEGATVGVPENGDVTCTATNRWTGPILTLEKRVLGDGTAVPTDWTLTATGPTNLSGVSGSRAVTRVPVTAGTYTLAESGGPDGDEEYVADPWECFGGGVLEGDDTVTLTDGEEVTCRITNELDEDDEPTEPTSPPTTPPTTEPSSPPTTEPSSPPTTGPSPSTATSPTPAPTSPSGSGGSGGSGGTGATEGTGALPGTGATVAASAILLGAALLVGGGALLLIGRKRRDHGRE